MIFIPKFLPSFLRGSCLVFSATCYAADAEWWSEANKRIEQHRKAPLHVTVIDQQGQKIAGAKVHVAMTRHAFEFGSAVKVAAINDPEREDYRQKILELFNSGTFENALKVKAWSGDFGPAVGPEATVQALHWTHENGIKIRGHAMTGNSIRRSSKAFIKLYEEGGKPAIIEAVMKSIDDKAAQTGFAIDEWDVVNHPVGIQRPGGEAAGAGNTQPRGQVFGIEESIGWFERSRANLPEGRLYLNESGVLPSPEDDSPQVQ
ncbi:endo-1,4-beta-xylanase, partial [Opitutaceae bacterium]|nr:endo-1,4-beta-xylanase [Opitutaceae bacterium]